VVILLLPVDVSGINSRITNNENNLNSLSTNSILLINNLNTLQQVY
jgi:hypothetical protein